MFRVSEEGQSRRPPGGLWIRHYLCVKFNYQLSVTTRQNNKKNIYVHDRKLPE